MTEMPKFVPPKENSALDSFKIDAMTVPEDIADQVYNVVNAARYLTRYCPILVEAPWTAISKEQSQSVIGAVWEASLLPADSPGLSGLYRHLTNVLTDEETPPVQKYSAMILSDVVMLQTGVPLEEKNFYKQDHDIKGRKYRRHLLDRVASFFDNVPDQPESDTAFVDMLTAHNNYLAKLEAEAMTEPMTIEAYTERVNAANDRLFLETSLLYSLVGRMLSPDLSEQLSAVRIQDYKNFQKSDHGAGLLIDGKLGHLHPAVRQGIWATSMINNHVFAEEKGSKAQELGSYFLTHPETSENFWQIIGEFPRERVPVADANARISAVPLFYHQTEWFFLQDEATVTAFLQTFPKEGAKEHLTNSGQFLIGSVAAFKSLHPDHPNTVFLQNAVAEFATQHKLTKKVAEAMDILTDTVPGIISLRRYGIDATRRMQDQGGQDLLSKDAALLYESKAQLAQPTERIQREVSTELPTQESVLVVAPGEHTQLFGWSEIQRPHPEDIPRILTHLATRLDNREPDEEGLLELATQEVTTIGSHEQVAVLPNLLDPEHELSVLGAVGIVAVQRTGDSLSLVVDASRAKIAIEGTPFIVLTGEREGDNEVQLTHAPDDFAGSLLQLGLTGAVLSSYRVPSEGLKVGKKVSDRMNLIPEGISEWNTSGRKKDYPQLSIVPPDPDETAVMFPITKSDVVFLTMHDADTK